MKAIIGKKIGMTQVFGNDGKMTGVTAIMVEPNIVVGHRTIDRDGYQAAIIGTHAKREISKPLTGQLKASGITEQLSVIREFVSDELPELKSQIDLSIFAAGDMVDVTGTSKGKGFSGVIKRHNFHSGPKTHGSDHHRAPGSIGSAFPQRVIKGRRMPGHMGDEQVTVKKLEIIEVHPDQQILLIKGAVPGIKGSLVIVKGYENA